MEIFECIDGDNLYMFMPRTLVNLVMRGSNVIFLMNKRGNCDETNYN